ncbi:hypothetical protein FACS189454_03080 [Planctomycetales bacterium]|nr:hypothetical protein FACS189454_03080 [Planctomycetales bacterium]
MRVVLKDTAKQAKGQERLGWKRFLISSVPSVLIGIMRFRVATIKDLAEVHWGGLAH